MVPKIVAAFAAGKSSIELGSIDVCRDFTSVKDTVAAYAQMLLEPRSYGDVFNVCSSNEISIMSILEMLTEKAGYEIEVITNPDFVRKHELKVLRGSNEKIERKIGWQPTIELKTTLDEMFDRYQEQLSFV